MNFLPIFVTQVENEEGSPTETRALPTPEQGVGQTWKAQRALFSNYLLLERVTNHQVRREESPPLVTGSLLPLLSGSHGGAKT